MITIVSTVISFCLHGDNNIMKSIGTVNILLSFFGQTWTCPPYVHPMSTVYLCDNVLTSCSFILCPLCPLFFTNFIERVVIYNIYNKSTGHLDNSKKPRVYRGYHENITVDTAGHVHLCPTMSSYLCHHPLTLLVVSYG